VSVDREFQLCKTTRTAEMSLLAKARSCTTCLMLAPEAAIWLARSARPPGRSLMMAVNRQKAAIGDKAALDDAAQDVWIDVCRRRKGERPVCRQIRQADLRDRRPAASRPHLRRRLSLIQRSARSRSRFVPRFTITVSIDTFARDGESRSRPLAEWRGRRPMLAVTRFASVFLPSARRRSWRRSRLRSRLSSPGGRSVFMANEIPAINPAPPTGTMTRSTSGTCSRISRPSVPWPRDDGGIIVAVDISQALLLRDLVRARLGFAKICPRGARHSRRVSDNCLTLMRGANFGMTTVAGMPNNLP